MGNQQRSAKESQEIIAEIHKGVIGDVYKAVAFYSNERGEVPHEKRHLSQKVWIGIYGKVPRHIVSTPRKPGIIIGIGTAGIGVLPKQEIMRRMN